MKTKITPKKAPFRFSIYVLFLLIIAGVTPLYAFSSEGPAEEGPTLEEWMNTPFEIIHFESDMLLEEWMNTPFEIIHFESEMLLEEWMNTPFEITYYESDVLLEDWMEEPFSI